MKNSKYLYGDNFDAQKLGNMNYISALFQKIEWATELVSKLNEVDYMKRDSVRIKACFDAQRFNAKLIDECELRVKSWHVEIPKFEDAAASVKPIPKDKQIVIETTYGTYVAIWSEADKKFVYANLQTDMYEGKWNMNYFENEYIEESEILKWREM